MSRTQRNRWMSAEIFRQGIVLLPHAMHHISAGNTDSAFEYATYNKNLYDVWRK